MAGLATQEDPRRVDPMILAQEELRRQQDAVGAILDDFKATVLDPISDVVPGLVIIDHQFSLVDKDGKEWGVTPGRFSEDGSSLVYAIMRGEMDVPHSDGRQVTIEPWLLLNREGPWPLTVNSSSLRQGSDSDDIEFVARKMAELLAPAKIAQAEQNQTEVIATRSDNPGNQRTWPHDMDDLRS